MNTLSQTVPPNDGLLGVTLAGRYRVERFIGKGGMGVVYEATHVQLNKRVAIKLLLAKYADDPESVERFHREAMTVTQIGNPHIVDVTDVGEAPDGRRFVVMELLQGQSLADALALTGPMAPTRVTHIMRQVLRGIGAAHAKGIVHRDLKPDNVFLIRRDDDNDFVKILDFGISKVIDANDANVKLTTTGAVVGTPIYMAPEQALGTDVDHRADLYAAAVMAYELLAGKPPFTAPSYLALVTMHLHTAPPSLRSHRPDAPPQLLTAIHKALAKDPQARFSSAGEFSRALPEASAASRSLPIATSLRHTISAKLQAATGGRRWPALVLFGGVALATSLALVRMTAAPLAATPPLAEAPIQPQDPPVPGPNLVPTQPAMGTLQITTVPTGARLTLDDKPLGLSPLTVETPFGPHTLVASLDGHEAAKLDVTVASHTPVPAQLGLTPLPEAKPIGPTNVSAKPAPDRDKPNTKPAPDRDKPNAKPTPGPGTAEVKAAAGGKPPTPATTDGPKRPADGLKLPTEGPKQPTDGPRLPQADSKPNPFGP